MIKMNEIDLGKKSLIILQLKINRAGYNLEPEHFVGDVAKTASRIKCSEEELREFFKKFMLPAILHGCGLGQKPVNTGVTDREAIIAFRVLSLKYFWDLRNLREEAYRITERAPLEFEDVAAILIYIAKKHIDDQFGEGETVRLEITK